MIIIRTEKQEDIESIREVNLMAFGQDGEGRLVDAIRQSDEFIPALSLVAIENGQVVGHILFSPIKIETQTGDVDALSLAPMAVRPEFQNRGIGSELVREGLKSCKRLGHKIVVVVGHPDYYPRFGFVPARKKGLEAPFPVPD